MRRAPLSFAATAALPTDRDSRTAFFGCRRPAVQRTRPASFRKHTRAVTFVITMSKGKVLITGGTGFVGSWVTARFLKEGHEVFVFDKNVSDTALLRYTCGDKAGQIKFVEGDITDAASVDSAVKGVDGVVHLAGLIDYDERRRPALEAVNVRGTTNIVEACKKHKTKRLVHMSSVAAIGFSTDGKTLAREDMPFLAESYHLSYFDTKHASERVVLEAAKKGEISAVCMNPTTIYGPGDAYKSSRSQQVKTAKGKNPYYTGGGVNVVHVDDAVECIYRGFKSSASGERYIVAGENVTIRQLLGMIAEEAGVKAPGIYIPNFVVWLLGFLRLMKFTKERATVTTVFHWADNAKATRELGVQFRGARDAIRASVSWMRENCVLEGTGPAEEKRKLK
eukprot:tig00000093_g3499.t1